jgi:hypothetical protein
MDGLLEVFFMVFVFVFEGRERENTQQNEPGSLQGTISIRGD